MAKKRTKKRPSKEYVLEKLFDEMLAGAHTEDVYRKYSKIWEYPKSTFRNHWTEVKKMHNRRREIINSAKAKKQAELEINRDILSRLDILEELSRIARGEHRTQGKSKPLIPTDTERIKAMEVIAKMQGYNLEQDNTTQNFVFQLNMPESKKYLPEQKTIDITPKDDAAG